MLYSLGCILCEYIMGNSYPNAAWCPDKSIAELVANGGGFQDVLLRRDLLSRCYTVNVSPLRDVQPNAWNEHHKIAFDVKMAEDYYLILLFPCHPISNKRTLYTYNHGSVTKLNREINARLRDSLPVSFGCDTTRLVIICGSTIYKLTNLIGTGYIVWASYVSTSNHNSVPQSIQADIPLFIHMDGFNQFESVLRILPTIEENHTVETLNVANTTFYIPFKVFLWTDEVDPRHHQGNHNKISVVTVEQVVDNNEDPQVQSLLHEPLPFSASEAESSTAGTPRTSRSMDILDLDSDEEISSLSQMTLSAAAFTPRIDRELPGFAGIVHGGALRSPDEK